MLILAFVEKKADAPSAMHSPISTKATQAFIREFSTLLLCNPKLSTENSAAKSTK